MLAQQIYMDDWLASQKQQHEASVFADPGLAYAQQAYDKMLRQGFADPAVAEAMKAQAQREKKISDLLYKYNNIETDNQKFSYLFNTDGWSNSQVYKTEAEAWNHMKEVEVKIWKIVDGKKVPSAKTLYVNEKIADMVSSIFDEIFYDPEHFPINVSKTGSFDWRYDGQTAPGTFSEHSHGIAIDINYGDNPFFKNGVKLTGRSYEPGVNPYAITKDSSVYKILQKIRVAVGR